MCLNEKGQTKIASLSYLYFLILASTFPKTLFRFQTRAKITTQIMKAKMKFQMLVSATANRSQLIHPQPTLDFSFFAEYINCLILIKSIQIKGTVG